MLFRSDRKSTRLNSSHTIISYAVFCLKKKAQKARRAARATVQPHATRAAARGHPASPSEALSAVAAARRPWSLRIAVGVFFFNDPATPETYPLPPPPAFPL